MAKVHDKFVIELAEVISGCDADGFFLYGENIVIAWMPLPEPYRGDDHAD